MREKKHPRLTVSLSHLQQDGLLQHNGENLILLVLLVIDDLHIQQLPESTRVKERGEEGAKQRWMVNSLALFRK